MKEVQSIKNTPQNKQPANLEAEQALIGSVLVNNDVIDEVSSFIKPSIFYDPAHVKIYEVIENLNNKGMIANPITLKNYFEKEKDELNIPEYLVKITKFSTSSRQAIEFSKLIFDLYVKRELIKISGENLSQFLKNFLMILSMRILKSKTQKI